MVGAQAVQLTSERSLAIDRKYFPLGSLFWVETLYPKKDKPFAKLMVSQDTGGAIKGVVRGDIFYGSGEVAEQHAAYMKNKGQYFILLPK